MTLSQIQAALDFNLWLDTHTRDPRAWQLLQDQRRELERLRRQLQFEIVAEIVCREFTQLPSS